MVYDGEIHRFPAPLRATVVVGHHRLNLGGGTVPGNEERNEVKGLIDTLAKDLIDNLKDPSALNSYSRI